MDSFMAPVLLRPAWHDAMKANAEFDPPDGKPAESAYGQRGEGNTVVSENCGGKAVLAEATFKGPPNRISARVGEPFAAEQVPREPIADGQRETPGPVAELELSLEIGAPCAIGLAEIGLGSFALIPS